MNGVQWGHPFHQFRNNTDPYNRVGDPSSGLLPGIADEDPGRQGQGDHRVQAYCFRLCLTNVSENRRPFRASRLKPPPTGTFMNASLGINSPGSPLLAAGDPADGPGTNIGAVPPGQNAKSAPGK